MAHDKELKEASFSIFQRQFCPVDGGEMRRSKTPVPNFGKPPPEEPALDGWPPVEEF